MHRNTKVATCCYCGSRAALVLGRDRHELTCAACGAPLRLLKSLQSDRMPPPGAGTAPNRPKKNRKPKRKRRKFIHAIMDLADEIGDIFD